MQVGGKKQKCEIVSHLGIGARMAKACTKADSLVIYPVEQILHGDDFLTS